MGRLTLCRAHLRRLTVVAGWDTATNLAAAVPGSQRENRGAFGAEAPIPVALNSRGTVNAVYARLMQLDGVIAVCLRGENKHLIRLSLTVSPSGPHSIYASVLGGTNGGCSDCALSHRVGGCDFNGNRSR